MPFLELLAECTIALTGFGAIVAVVRGADSPRGVFRAWSVVAQSAAAFMLSVTPLLLNQFHLADETVWTTASVAGLVLTGAIAMSNIVLDRQFSSRGFPPQAPAMIRTAQVCCLVTTLAMLLNAFGWPAPTGAPLYVAGVSLLVVAALIALLHSFYVPMQLTLSGDRPGADAPNPTTGSTTGASRLAATAQLEDPRRKREGEQES